MCGLALVAVSGATLHCGAWSSCSGLSCCGAWALGMQVSVVAAHGLGSCGSHAVVCGPSSHSTRAWLLCDMWNLSCFREQGSNPGHWQVDSYPQTTRKAPSRLKKKEFFFPPDKS